MILKFTNRHSNKELLHRSCIPLIFEGLNIFIMTHQFQSIVIIEDQDIIRQGVVSMLLTSQLFEEVHSFSTGEDALVQCPHLQPPQIILIDIGLPGIDGLETMKKMQEYWPVSRFLVFTIYEDNDHVFEALKYGASGYILKRESPENIMASIKETVNGGAPMSREIAKKIIQSFRVQEQDMVISHLTTREYELLKLLAEGYLNKEIADQLRISVYTVKNHLQNIYIKLHVQNRSEAIIKYMKSH